MGEADGQTVTEAVLLALPTEIRDRIRRVESEIRKAAQQGLDTEQLYDLLAGRKGLWRPDRESVHQDIVNGFLSKATDVPSDRQAIIIGGLGGAGKRPRRSYPLHQPCELRGSEATIRQVLCD
jgi:hypothetical protein